MITRPPRSLAAAAARLVRAAFWRCYGIVVDPAFTKRVGEAFFTLTLRRRGGTHIDIRRVRKILVVRLDNIGDVVLTTPMLRQLRRHFPDAYIAMLVRPRCRELLEYCPHVDEVIGFEWRITWRLEELQRRWQALTLAARSLWFRRFDLVLLPRWGDDHRSEGVIAYMSGAPWRVGFRDDLSSFRYEPQNGRGTLLTHVLQDGPARHEVEKHMEVLQFLGAEASRPPLELWTSPQDEAFAAELLRRNHVDPDDVLVVLGVGASHQRRLWPVERYAAVASWLVETYGARILVMGSEADKPVGRLLHQRVGAGVIDLTRETTLRQAGSLLRRATLFVGNDAGPVHLASAAGIPVVAISCHPQGGSPAHSNSPRRFGPWAVPHRVLQPDRGLDACTTACDAEEPHCVTGVTYLMVQAAIEAEMSAMGIGSGTLAAAPPDDAVSASTTQRGLP